MAGERTRSGSTVRGAEGPRKARPRGPETGTTAEEAGGVGTWDRFDFEDSGASRSRGGENRKNKREQSGNTAGAAASPAAGAGWRPGGARGDVARALPLSNAEGPVARGVAALIARKRAQTRLDHAPGVVRAEEGFETARPRRIALGWFGSGGSSEVKAAASGAGRAARGERRGASGAGRAAPGVRRGRGVRFAFRFAKARRGVSREAHSRASAFGMGPSAAGVAAARGLWSSSDLASWHRALEGVVDSVEASRGPEAAAQERWWIGELPRRLEKSRQKPSLERSDLPGPFSRADLVALMSWKLRRGTWRPRLLALSSENGEADVQRAGNEALEALWAREGAAEEGRGERRGSVETEKRGGKGDDDGRRKSAKKAALPRCDETTVPTSRSTVAAPASSALCSRSPPRPTTLPSPASRAPSPPPPSPRVAAALTALASLRGVGPATASAVLSSFDASVAFLSDEAQEAALEGKREYSLKRAIELTRRLREKAAELNALEDDKEKEKEKEKETEEVGKGDDGGGGDGNGDRDDEGIEGLGRRGGKREAETKRKKLQTLSSGEKTLNAPGAPDDEKSDLNTFISTTSKKASERATFAHHRRRPFLWTARSVEEALFGAAAAAESTRARPNDAVRALERNPPSKAESAPDRARPSGKRRRMTNGDGTNGSLNRPASPQHPASARELRALRRQQAER